MLKFELSIEEANMILGALGKQPFETVANIVTKIQQQAQPQLAALAAAGGAESAAEKAEA